MDFRSFTDFKDAGPHVIKPADFFNSGDSDASPDGIPSHFLLMRPLEASVNEEVLVKGVAKLYKPSANGESIAASSKKKSAKVASTTGDSNLGAREGSIRRVLLVRDRQTNESWRYGFAEFATVEVCFPCGLEVLIPPGCSSSADSLQFF